MRLGQLTYLILELNAAIDRGETITLDDAKRHIESGDVLTWLSTTGTNLDTSMLIGPSATDGEDIVKGLQGILGGYGGRERRKWGVEKNGLCLLLAWTNELIQQRAFND